MSTRSAIAKITENGIKSIYVHFDGYPEGVGATLQKHYQDEDKIDELLELGDLSTLGSEIGKKQDFNSYKSESNTCLAYGRDRGEKNVGAKTHDAIEAFMTYRKRCTCEYLYLRKEGAWNVYCFHDDMPMWRNLNEVLKETKA